jgi:hypothetical protein
MALTANRQVDRFVDQELRTVAVAGGAHIYRGALVEWQSAGYASPVTGNGIFAGLAYEEMNNGGGADGDVSGRVYTDGDFSMPLAGVTRADVGQAVYATDDATLTLGGARGTFVGHVQSVPSPGRIILRLAGSGQARAARIEHRAESFALAAGQSGLTLTNLGATGAVTASLPQNPPAGTCFAFVCMEDQLLRVAPGAGGGIYVKGAKQADNKYVAIGDIGDFLHLVADGNGDWVAVASIGGADADITVES